jgi:uncharacterized protein YbjQ (UPF0145 family)
MNLEHRSPIGRLRMNSGGNAVLAMRFKTSVGELGTEVCAYGTAVVVSPVS